MTRSRLAQRGKPRLLLKWLLLMMASVLAPSACIHLPPEVAAEFEPHDGHRPNHYARSVGDAALTVAPPTER